MKKIIRIALLVSVLALLLCVSALAADEAGIYEVTTVEGVTIEPVGEKSEVEIEGRPAEFYAGAEKLTVSYSGAESGKNYLLFVTSSETKLPTEKDLVYIDQIRVEGNTVSFTAYPSALGKGTYYVYLSSDSAHAPDGGKLTKIGSFKSYVPYKLGDVNDDTSIDSDDALLILKHSVHLVTLDSTPKLAADVNKDSSIDSDDALLVLKYSVHLITEF